MSHPTCRARSLAWRVVEQKKWPSNFFWRAGKGPKSPPPAPWKICELCYYCHLLRKTYRERLLPSNCSVYWSAVPRSRDKSCSWHNSLPCLLPHSQDQRVMKKWYVAELRKALLADSFRNIILYLRHILPFMWHNDCNVLILYLSDNQNMSLHVWALHWEQDPKIQGSSGIATRVDPKVTGFC